MTQDTPEAPTAFHWAVPEALGVPLDPLVARIDIHETAILLSMRTAGQNPTVETRLVSATALARAMAETLPLKTGLLPENTLWWCQTRDGPLYALWRPPRVWKVAIIESENTEIKRRALPMPGLIFLCQSARPPSVFAATSRPTKEEDQLYHAPLFNVYFNGDSCPGSHRYPERVADIPESFFASVFSGHGDRGARSRTFGEDLFALWAFLDGQKEYPLEDLAPALTVEHAMAIRNP